MECPRDKTALREQRYEADVMVDSCGSCGGMWLDEGELKAIQDSRERDHSVALAAMPDMLRSAGLSDEMRRQKDAPTGPCPRCGTQLVTDEYAHCSQVIIDVCPKGCGVWLDKGELQAIEVFFEKSRLEAKDDDDLLWRLRAFWLGLRGGGRKARASKLKTPGTT